MEKRSARHKFSFLPQQNYTGPPHLGRKGSGSNNEIRKKYKKDANGTKDVIKHLPGEQLAAVKIKGKRKKMRWRLKSADMTDGWGILVKFSFARALSFTFKSLSSGMCCIHSNLFLLYNETLRNWVIQQTSSLHPSDRTWVHRFFIIF